MIRPAERQDFIAIASALNENQRRMLSAIAPEPTPLAPPIRGPGLAPFGQ
jgi:hypothetical protein